MEQVVRSDELGEHQWELFFSQLRRGSVGEEGRGVNVATQSGRVEEQTYCRMTERGRILPEDHADAI